MGGTGLGGGREGAEVKKREMTSFFLYKIRVKNIKRHEERVKI
jgi:hypothetical protein